METDLVYIAQMQLVYWVLTIGIVVGTCWLLNKVEQKFDRRPDEKK